MPTKKPSPTQRVLAHLRKESFDAVQVVEHWVSFSRTRRDLFGFIDIVAIKDGTTFGIQATSYSNMNARIKKIRSIDAFQHVLKAGWVIQVQAPKQCKKSKRWSIVIKDIKLDA